MAHRAVWRGAISFGLIYVPVEMHTAARDGSLHLHLLDSRDFAPIGYERINKTTGKTVDWSDIVKGYEYAKGSFVALNDADFKHANVKASETIDIANFCAAAEVPPVYVDTPYYLAPAKGGQKVYALLRDALQASGKVAIATFVMRGRQHLCMVAPMGRALLAITLRFADELLPSDDLDLPGAARGAKVSAAELSMAQRLVSEMTAPFDPAAFKDTYRADLMRRIKDKVRRKQTHQLTTEDPLASTRPKAEVIDLMAALRDSLKSGKRSAPASAAARRRVHPVPRRRTRA